MIEPAEAPHHHHQPTGLPWFDLLVPIAVIAVSVASLLNAWQSERSMKALVEQNRRLVSAQSTPLLTYETGNFDDKGKFAITMRISNVGTGPAEIVWFKATDDHGVDYSGTALTQRVMQLDPKSIPASQRVDTLLRNGDDRLIFRWPKPTGNPAALAAWEKLNQDRFHLRMGACYCSIFGECRITDFESIQTKPVASCKQT